MAAIEGKGRGVIATKPFEPRDFIVEYAGDLISDSQARERENKYGASVKGCYMFYFKHKDATYWLVLLSLQ